MNIKKNRLALTISGCQRLWRGGLVYREIVSVGGDNRTVLSLDCGYLIVCVCQLFLELYTTCKFYLNKPEFKKLHICLFYFQMRSLCSSLTFIYS